MTARPGRPLWRALRLLAWRPALVLAGGISIAVVGEISAIALIGLAGWFIAGCYLSGLSTFSTFSYLAPSGGVRAFALSRIVARYTQRLVGHDATLQWLTRLRVRMFDDAAAAPAAARSLRDGQALDRAVADADVLSEALIRSVLPFTAIALTAGAGVAAVAVLSGPAALTFAIGGAVTALSSFMRPGRPGGSAAAERGRARAELVSAAETWPELVSLGGVADLRAATGERLDLLDRAAVAETRRWSCARSRVAVAGGLTLVALCGVVLGPGPRLGLADLTLVLLIGAGVLDLLGGTADAMHAALRARDAARRLDALTDRGRSEVRGTPAERVPSGPLSVDVAGLRLAARPGSGPACFTLAPGGVLIVTGRSGRGKTTLLRTISGDVAAPGGTVRVGGVAPDRLVPGQLVFVEHDDHIFAGTVADNLRLADPDLDELDVRRLLRSVRLDGDGMGPETRIGTGGRALSGGERRRLALARAMAARPAVLLLDEPVEGVDPGTAREVLGDLRSALPDTTLIVAVHDRHLSDLPPGFGETLSLDDGIAWRETSAWRSGESEVTREEAVVPPAVLLASPISDVRPT